MFYKDNNGLGDVFIDEITQVKYQDQGDTNFYFGLAYENFLIDSNSNTYFDLKDINYIEFLPWSALGIAFN